MSRRSRLPLLAAAALVALATGAALAGPTIPGLPATPTAFPAHSVAASYQVFDAAGRATGKAKWHWNTVGGNCCEVYVSSTSKGQLLEFGGTEPYTSSDNGKTWQRVVFPTPLYNGEGAIVAGPNGNVYGIGWDPYTGDHLQGVRYTGSQKKWEVAEAPIHSPVFDREWITYAQGPFLVDGQKVPFITLVRGGTATKAVELIAKDGLSYTTVSDPGLDVMQDATEPGNFAIPVVKNPAADHWQPNGGAFTVPLNAGGVLLLNNSGDDLPCDAARLNPTSLKWQCVRLPFVPKGVIRQDSRGWLTMVSRAGNTLTVQTSRNGGRTWKGTELVPPARLKQISSSGDYFDVKVNGALGQAVVATRMVDSAGRNQDLVWRLDVRGAQPKVSTLYAAGLGNAEAAVGLVAGAAADRFDFPSVTLLPNGRIALAFSDATTPRHVPREGVPSTGSVTNPKGGHSPAMAILD